MRPYQVERRRICRSGKIRYPNELGAKIAQAELAGRGHVRRIYRCLWCRGWHLTSQMGGG